MSLPNHRTLGISGASAGVQAPTTMKVDEGRILTKDQMAGVKWAYQQFSTAVKLSTAPFHKDRRVLLDGTAISMTSKYGTDEVRVWPPGDGEGTDMVRGIGLCFVDSDFLPVDKWDYEKDGLALPRPLVLRAAPKRDSAGKIIGSLHTWRIQPVMKLLGGQRLWVNEDLKFWFSSFSAPIYAQPGALASAIIRGDSSSQIINFEWTPYTYDRIPASWTYEDTPRLTSDVGKYVFWRNYTVVLGEVPTFYPWFMTKMQLAGDEAVRPYIQQVVPYSSSLINGLKVYRGKLVGEGRRKLAVETPDLTAERTYAGLVANVSVPMTSRLIPQTLSVHPNGKFALCSTFVDPTPPGGSAYGDDYIAIELDKETPTFTTGSLGLYATAGPATGTATAALSRTEWPEMIGESHTGVVKWHEVLTASGGFSASNTSSAPNRHYYDLLGNLLTESVTEAYAATLSMTFAGESGSEVATTRTVNTTRTTVQTTTLVLPRRSYVTNTSTLSKTDIAARTGAGTDYTSSATFSQTRRNIIFYDDINDFLIYTEYTVGGTCSGTLADNPNIASLVTADPLTVYLYTEFKSVRTELLQFPVTAALSKSAACVTTEFINSGASKPAFDAWGWSTAGQVQAPMETVATMGGPINWYPTTDQTWSGTAASRIYLDAPSMSVGLGHLGPLDPTTYLKVNFARDPTSTACLVNLRLLETVNVAPSNKTWFFAVSSDAVSKLQDLFPDAPLIPDDVQLDAFTLNALVSI